MARRLWLFVFLRCQCAIILFYCWIRSTIAVGGAEARPQAPICATTISSQLIPGSAHRLD